MSLYNEQPTLEDRIHLVELRLDALEAGTPLTKEEQQLQPGVRILKNGRYMKDGLLIKKEEAYL